MACVFVHSKHNIGTTHLFGCILHCIQINATDKKADALHIGSLSDNVIMAEPILTSLQVKCADDTNLHKCKLLHLLHQHYAVDSLYVDIKAGLIKIPLDLGMVGPL